MEDDGTTMPRRRDDGKAGLDFEKPVGRDQVVEPAIGFHGWREGAFVDERGADGHSWTKRKTLDLAGDFVHDARTDFAASLDLHDADGALRLIEEVDLAPAPGIALDCLSPWRGGEDERAVKPDEAVQLLFSSNEGVHAAESARNGSKIQAKFGHEKFKTSISCL